jgi:hypothetical protein
VGRAGAGSVLDVVVPGRCACAAGGAGAGHGATSGIVRLLTDLYAGQSVWLDAHAVGATERACAGVGSFHS